MSLFSLAATSFDILFTLVMTLAMCLSILVARGSPVCRHSWLSGLRASRQGEQSVFGQANHWTVARCAQTGCYWSAHQQFLNLWVSRSYHSSEKSVWVIDDLSLVDCFVLSAITPNWLKRKTCRWKFEAAGMEPAQCTTRPPITSPRTISRRRPGRAIWAPSSTTSPTSAAEMELLSSSSRPSSRWPNDPTPWPVVMKVTVSSSMAPNGRLRRICTQICIAHHIVTALTSLSRSTSQSWRSQTVVWRERSRFSMSMTNEQGWSSTCFHAESVSPPTIPSPISSRYSSIKLSHILQLRP